MIGDNLTIGLLVGAALADSVNPCVLGVLIFLLLFLTRTFKSRNKMLICGLFYSVVVYATYLLLGFGILHIAALTGLSRGFYWLAASVAIIAGLLEIKDYFWYGRGFTLQMIPGAGDRLKRYTAKIEQLSNAHFGWTILVILFIGVFVVLVELPCTGAPYFAILALLAQGAYSEAIPLLLLYNFVFIIPLLVVLGLAYIGQAEKLERWRMQHRGLMRLVICIFLIGLGLYMIETIYPLF